MIVCDDLFGGSKPAPEITTPKRKKRSEQVEKDKFAVLLCGHAEDIEQYRSPYESDCLAWLRYHKADIHAGWNNYKTADGVLYRIKRLDK